MRPVLILQHQTPERPAYLTTWLDQHGIPHETRNAGRGDEFPSSIEPYAAMAIMGGGMSANDPLLSNRQAEILILQAVLRGRPTIGHCLGGQLMTRALGGKISESPLPEIGWHDIKWSDNILREQWFGSQPTPVVIQWHYDTFSVPEGATLLASSDACSHQAWCMGPHLAMQFHIEMDRTKAQEWAADEDPKWAAARTQHKTAHTGEQIIAGIEPYLEHHQATADHIYRRWLEPTVWAVQAE